MRPRSVIGYCQLIVFFMLIFIGRTAQATSQSLTLTSEHQSQSLAQHFQLLRTAHPVALTTILTPNYQQQFINATGRDSLHMGYTTDQIWLKLIVHNPSAQRIKRILHFQYAYLDQVTLYQQQADRWQPQYSGYQRPANERAMPVSRPAFQLIFPPHSTKTIYIQVRASGSMTVDAALSSINAYEHSTHKTLLVLAMYFGMMLALGCYNLMLFIRLRQLDFLLYSGFVAIFGLTAFYMNGLGPVYLWHPQYFDISHIVPTGYIFAVAMALFFARQFLILGWRAPKWDIAIRTCQPFCIAVGLLSMLVSTQHALQIMSVVGVSMALFLFCCGIVAVRWGTPSARCYLLAWFCLLLGTALVSIRNFGVIPSNFFTVYGLQLGSSLELMLLSFGLAARITELRHEQLTTQNQLIDTLQAQELTLARRVAQRTFQLEQAKLQLEKQAIRDPLTGLYNREGLAQIFTRIKKRRRQTEDYLFLLVIDLDNFKPINDHFGHPVGDQVLTTVAQRLQHLAQQTGNSEAARVGGDEFVIIGYGPATHLETTNLAERVSTLLQQPMPLENHTMLVGASIGSYQQPVAGAELHTLFRLADREMYHHKRDDKSANNG